MQSITLVVTTREEKQVLKLEIKTYLDRAEEIALLSQVITLLCDEIYNLMLLFLF